MTGGSRRVDFAAQLFPKNFCSRPRSLRICARTLKNQKSVLESCEPMKRREGTERFPMRIHACETERPKILLRPCYVLPRE